MIGLSRAFQTGNTGSTSSIPDFSACSAQFPNATAKRAVDSLIGFTLKQIDQRCCDRNGGW
jgi:hypothetical protein